MAGQTNEGGERRRALDAERTGSGRRVPGHAAPVPEAFGAPDPFTTPADGTRAVWPAPAPAPAGRTEHRTGSGAALPPTPSLGTPLPSRRDRAALRRPTALDEAAVQASVLASAQASESAAWRTSPALEDPRTASAIARPSPLTHALARTLTEHLDSLTPPAGLSTATSSGSADPASAAPAVYVPRRRPAPTVSGPLPVVGTTTTPAEPRREPSWTTEPVVSRRAQRPAPASPVDAAPFAPFPAGERELPPPPPAAEVEAAVRARAARLSTAPVPPPMPDRVSAEPTGRTSYLVPGLPGPLTTGLPAAAPRPQPVSGPTAALTAADLAVLRAATTAAPAVPAAAAPAATAAPASADTTSTAAVAAEPRHGRATGRAAGRTTGRTGRGAGTTGRTTGRVERGAGAAAAPEADPATSPTTSPTNTPRTGPETSRDGAGRGTRPAGRSGSSARPGGRSDGGRRWHQRRALGMPVGILAAAVALAAAVVVGTMPGAPGHEEITGVLASASRNQPGAATPAAATPTAARSAGSTAQSAAATAAGGAPGEGQAAAAAQKTGASPAASQPAAPASSAPAASARTTPLGDVTYEGFGTAKDTYVEMGTKDSRDVRKDLGSTFTKTMTGSKDWSGWYVAVSNFDRATGGTVGCRIKDSDGTVLAQETSTNAGEPATCIVGAPAGIN